MSLDLFAVLLGGATALLPIYARDIPGTGPGGLGLLRVRPRRRARSSCPWRWRAIRLDATPAPCSSVASWCSAWPPRCSGVSTDLGLSLIALGVLGGSDLLSMIIRQSLVAAAHTRTACAAA